jgi:YD repeat-containing protein
VGRLCRIDDAAGSRHFAYDPFGRLAEQWTVELGQTHRQTFAWDAQGRLLGSTNGGGAVSLRRDADGGVKGVHATS